MWPRFGVKIGNSTLSIAYVKEGGKPEVIANKQGDRTSQACLLWDGADEIECGLTAKQKMGLRPKQAIANSFQFLLPPEQLKSEKVEEARREIPCEYDTLSHCFQLKCVISSPTDDDSTKETTKELTAYEAHVKLFRAELELARQYHTDSAHKPIVVLSIPNYYPLAAWSQLANTAEEAGFHVAQVIEEPNAALLAYGIGESEMDKKHVLTIKCGGLFSHFAVYSVQDGFYTHLCSFGPFTIGGSLFTEAVVQFICEEFKKKWKLDPAESRRSIAKIKVAAANCKHILTTMPTTQIYIDSLMDGIDFNMQMSRARFESLIQPATSKFMQKLNSCVEEALRDHQEIKNIDAIVLLGATMQIPKLQAVIGGRFPEAQLHSTIPADEVVAIGCARQSAFLNHPRGQILEPESDELFLEEDMKIWHGDDVESAQVLLQKGSLIPTRVQVNVTPCGAAQNMDIFKVNLGDELKEFCLKDAATSAEGVYKIEAEIGVNEDDDTPHVVLRCF